jgi:hypothetical protein
LFCIAVIYMAKHPKILEYACRLLKLSLKKLKTGVLTHLWRVKLPLKRNLLAGPIGVKLRPSQRRRVLLRMHLHPRLQPKRNPGRRGLQAARVVGKQQTDLRVRQPIHQKALTKRG